MFKDCAMRMAADKSTAYKFEPLSTIQLPAKGVHDSNLPEDMSTRSDQTDGLHAAT
jgi:hypothetical protein